MLFWIELHVSERERKSASGDLSKADERKFRNRETAAWFKRQIRLFSRAFSRVFLFQLKLKYKSFIIIIILFNWNRNQNRRQTRLEHQAWKKYHQIKNSKLQKITWNQNKWLHYLLNSQFLNPFPAAQYCMDLK